MEERIELGRSHLSLHAFRLCSSKCVSIVDIYVKIYTRGTFTRVVCTRAIFVQSSAQIGDTRYYTENQTLDEQLGTMSGKCPQKSVKKKKKKKWISLVDYSPPFCAIIGSIATNRTRKIGVILTTLFPVFSRSPVITAHLIPAFHLWKNKSRSS